MSGRIAFYREKYGEAAYKLLLQLKQTFDPNNILNAGNLEGEGYIEK
jgi:FAD/FMN-containing dehydrogenase